MDLFFRGLCNHCDTCDSKKAKTPVGCARTRAWEQLEALEELEALEGLERLEELERLEGLEILERLATLERLAFAGSELLEEVGIFRFKFGDDSFKGFVFSLELSELFGLLESVLIARCIHSLSDATFCKEFLL